MLVGLSIFGNANSKNLERISLSIWFVMQAASLRIAEQYIHAFSNIAKEVAYKLVYMQVQVALHWLLILI